MRRGLVISLIGLAALMLGVAVEDTTASTTGQWVNYYWLSGVDGNGQFCVNQGLHNWDYAFDLTKYAGVNCGGSGALNDLVAARTTGYTPSTEVVLRADWYTGEYADGCDYAEGVLHSQPDGILRGNVRYLHARYPGANGYYGTLYIPAGPNGRAFAWGVANLTNDGDGCAWTGYHVHQGITDQRCMDAWGSMSARAQPYNTWSTMAHLIGYTEGVSCY